MKEMRELNTKAADSTNFNKIYENCRDQVLRIAYSYTKREDIAEEIMQDTFLELHRKGDEIKEETAENWVLKVAKNKAVNWSLRSMKEIEKLETLEENNQELVAKSVEEKYFEEEYHAGLVRLGREIFTDLQKENENWYEAFVRVYGRQETKREAAKEMNLSAEAMYATLYRARNWIKRKYGKKLSAMFDL